jgi:hypothetical protein
MGAMSSQVIDPREGALCLKEPLGWFVAGSSFRRALRTLSDGGFKLFAHLCLEADRRTGRYAATQAELAKAIGKSRRIVGKYIEELEHKEICAVGLGRNQYSKTSFEIRDSYWPYRKTKESEGSGDQVGNAYVDAIKNQFVSYGCTGGRFTSRDAQYAQELQRRGVPLQTVKEALLMGAARKYSSWINGGSPEKIGSLSYFSSLVLEIQERPLPPGYREYLRKKIVRLTKQWTEETSKGNENGGCSDMPCPQNVL